MKPVVAVRFEGVFRVEPGDIDVRRHVNNQVYLRWVQEMAEAHWRSIAPEPDRDTIGWVVLRHEIDYRLAAVLGDEIIAQTWVGPATGMSFERNTAILRASDRALLVEARTLWCPVDAQTGRPRRVSAAARALYSSGRNVAGEGG